MYFFIFDKPTQLRSKIRIWVFQILLVFKLTEKVTCYFCCIVFLYWKHGNLLLETVLLMTFFFFCYISAESCSPREAKNAENKLG